MKARKAIPRASAKRLAAEPDLRLRNSTVSRSPLQQTPRKPIPKVNVKAKARRDASYRKYMGSKEWKALRLKVFERDGFRCTFTTRVHTVLSFMGQEIKMGPPQDRRCQFVDESHTGRDLICDHLRYTHFGHEPLRDLRTLCRTHNARLTVSERANWAQPGKRT